MVYSNDGPIIAVLGATGLQGGSVIKALLESQHRYQIRALTRDPSSAASKAINPSVEVVAADANDPTSLAFAFKGAKYVFGMTNFWETRDGAKEEATAKAIVDAAKLAGVDLFLWAGLPSVEEISKGKYTAVAHFDSKARIFEYAKQSGLPTISIEPSFYAVNILREMIPRKQPDGSYVLSLPVSGETVVPIIDTEWDYGIFVQEAIESGAFKANSRVLAAAEYITFDEMMKTWSEVLGEKGVYKQIARDVFAGFFPSPDLGFEFVSMFDYFRDYGYYNGEDLAPSHAHLSRPPRKWRDYVKAVDWSPVLKESAKNVREDHMRN